MSRGERGTRDYHPTSRYHSDRDDRDWRERGRGGDRDRDASRGRGYGRDDRSDRWERDSRDRVERGHRDQRERGKGHSPSRGGRGSDYRRRESGSGGRYSSSGRDSGRDREDTSVDVEGVCVTTLNASDTFRPFSTKNQAATTAAQRHEARTVVRAAGHMRTALSCQTDGGVKEGGGGGAGSEASVPTSLSLPLPPCIKVLTGVGKTEGEREAGSASPSPVCVPVPLGPVLSVLAAANTPPPLSSPDPLACFHCPDQPFGHAIEKYWAQRYRLFPRHDEGTGFVADPEGWFSTVPEAMGKQIGGVIVSALGEGSVLCDPMCGCGTSLIHALTAHPSLTGVAGDIDPLRVAMCHRNCEIAGVADRVSFYVADCLCEGPGSLSAALERDGIQCSCVITSPPFGGPEYATKPTFDLACDLPQCLSALIPSLHRLSDTLCLLMPRNTRLDNLPALLHPDTPSTGGASTDPKVEGCILTLNTKPKMCAVMTGGLVDASRPRCSQALLAKARWVMKRGPRTGQGQGQGRGRGGKRWRR
ncbi:RNA cap guanine-N2 methyltransferase [Kipferlia bialata]|uniref:Trimethylguanosine synthase n=1 Tax=Kipferlia bialata TaxID=797122 RepID=A0A9K3GEX0_9EUKA|nr:RNA cap guanine-N2 methyltransferase [Kipferlia bialata]|eukprot:g2374.t1